MAKECKYYKQKKQVSYDCEQTWEDIIPYQYQRGDLYESLSTDCGYVQPFLGKFKAIFRDGSTEEVNCNNISTLREEDTKQSHKTGMTEAYIGSCVRNIGTYALAGLSYLNKLNSNEEAVFNIPKNVISIGNGAFADCSNFETCMLPDNLLSIGACAFSGCSRLGNINIPSGITKIEDSTFCYSGLESITLPNSITYIGESAFRHSSLNYIEIPGSVREIDEEAFDYCVNLTRVNSNEDGVFNIPTGVVSLRGFGFCDGLVTCTLPNTVETFNNTFRNCVNLRSINIPDSVTSLGFQTFRGCTSITSVGPKGSGASVEISNGGEKDTGYATFTDSDTLKSVVLPDCVTRIGNYTFSGCSALETCVIGNGVKIIDKYAFSHCSSLTSCTIGNNVTTIGYWAFKGCSSLRSITIPDSVTTIGESGFCNCVSLESIVIPDNVTSIDDAAFQYCSGLTSVTIGSGVTNINSSVFNSCSSLTSVTIPNTIGYIGYSAFHHCSGFTSITCLATTPPYIPSGSGAFDDTNNCPIYVPSQSVSAYKSASGWSTYKSRIQPIS